MWRGWPRGSSADATGRRRSPSLPSVRAARRRAARRPTGSILEEEGNGFYAQCMDCGCYTVHVDYKNEEDRLEAAKRAAELFNTGKVLKSNPGE